MKSKLQIINKNKQVSQHTKKKSTPTWNTGNPQQKEQEMFYNGGNPPAQQTSLNGSQQQLNQFSNYQF